MKCNKKGCDNLATKQAHCFVHTQTSTEPAIAAMPLFVCETCATPEAALEILVDNIPGRRQVEDVFEKEGLPRPDWTRSYTEWVDVEGL